MKKILLSLAAALIICVPAFADITNDSYFAALPFSVNSRVANYVITANAGDVYCFIQGTHCYAISESSGSIHISGTDQNGMTVNSDQVLSTGFGNTSYYFVYYGEVSSGGFASSPFINVVPDGYSRNDIGSAFADFLSSPDSPVGITTVLVPRGNVLYFKAASDYVFGFEAEFTEYSALFGGGDVYGPWGDTYQRLSIESSLPTAGITFPRPNSTAISWEKGAPYNVLGQSKRGLYRTTVEADGNYVAFYNPAYQSVQSSEGIGAAEVGCNVWVSGDFDFIRIYPLQQLLDTSSSPDGYENYLNGTPDGDTVIWTDPNDNVSAPVSGGDNQEDEPISSVSLIEAIKRILRNILSEIENIFTFGFSAIRDLVDLMDEFVATFDDLYEWLPEECYTLLIACVSVAIVIGVFKVFL